MRVMHMNYSCYTQESKPTAKRREKELYLSSLSNADIVILCDGEDYCYFVIITIIRRRRSAIGQHSP
jgi:hypothetical protein